MGKCLGSLNILFFTLNKMSAHNTLFVSAFIDLHIPHEEHKTIDMRIGNFEKLAETGIPLAVFTSKKYEERVKEISNKYENVIIHKIIEIENTETYKLFNKYKDSLPPIRYAIKDKFEFLTLMNAKLEFMKEIVEKYDKLFSQFAWIDFNIWYIFKNNFEISKRLWFYSKNKLKCDGVFIPGCWQKGREADLLWNRINWRFCGGFFMGNKKSITEFVDLYFKNINNILDDKKMLTWEVNIWSQLENEYGWEPKWYPGDHNESMINIPIDNFDVCNFDVYVKHNEQIIQLICKNNNATTGKYLLPPVPGFEPTSPSFIEYFGQKLLNVRFVNYTLTPQGAYIIRNKHGHLYTRNMCVTIDNKYKVIIPTMMNDKPNNLVTRHESIQGVEDIRLFIDQNTVKFIGTQREFSNENVNRMIIGDYDFVTSKLSNATVVEPPEFTGCEKNWIPIHKNGKLHFIYKWFPFQLGELENNKLVVRDEFVVPPIFERMRGSSTFIPFDNSFVGVIHYSEEGSPRKYFHALVWLDKQTCRPTHISDIFLFNKLGIEFCIGFTISIEDNIPYARFWFSQHDRDPMWIRIPLVCIKKFKL
jgi:hypothetical protein